MPHHLHNNLITKTPPTHNKPPTNIQNNLQQPSILQRNQNSHQQPPQLSPILQLTQITTQSAISPTHLKKQRRLPQQPTQNTHNKLIISTRRPTHILKHNQLHHTASPTKTQLQTRQRLRRQQTIKRKGQKQLKHNIPIQPTQTQTLTTNISTNKTTHSQPTQHLHTPPLTSLPNNTQKLHTIHHTIIMLIRTTTTPYNHKTIHSQLQTYTLHNQIHTHTKHQRQLRHLQLTSSKPTTSPTTHHHQYHTTHHLTTRSRTNPNSPQTNKTLVSTNLSQPNPPRPHQKHTRIQPRQRQSTINIQPPSTLQPLHKFSTTSSRRTTSTLSHPQITIIPTQQSRRHLPTQTQNRSLKQINQQQ